MPGTDSEFSLAFGSPPTRAAVTSHFMIWPGEGMVNLSGWLWGSGQHLSSPGMTVSSGALQRRGRLRAPLCWGFAGSCLFFFGVSPFVFFFLAPHALLPLFRLLADFWWFAGMFLLMHCGGVGSYPGKSGLQCYWEVLYFLLLVGKFAGGCQVTVAGNGLHLLP